MSYATSESKTYIYRFAPNNSFAIDIFDPTAGNLSYPTYTIFNNNTIIDVSVLNGMIVIGTLLPDLVSSTLVIVSPDPQQSYLVPTFQNIELGATLSGMHAYYDATKYGFKPHVALMLGTSDVFGNPTFNFYDLDLLASNQVGALIVQQFIKDPFTLNQENLNFNIRVSSNFYFIAQQNSTAIIYLRKADRSYKLDYKTLDNIYRVWMDQAQESIFVLYLNNTIAIYQLQRPIIDNKDSSFFQGQDIFNFYSLPIGSLKPFSYMNGTSNSVGFVYNYEQFLEKYPQPSGVSQLQSVVSSLSAISVTSNWNVVNVDQISISIA